jgi:predicted dehydrogenase
MTGITTIGVVGSGWRADFYLRLAGLLPDRLAVVGVAVRRPETGEQVSARWGVPTYLTPAELIAKQHPDYVVTCLPWPVNPEVVGDLAEAGVRVLSETPPAPDADGLRRLWDRAGAGGLVQIAEQYLLLPGHAARRKLIEHGAIGRPTSVQVSSTHMYHAVSLMRGMLGAGAPAGFSFGFGPVTASAARFTAPLADPIARDGWTDDDTPKEAGTTIATLDFGDGASGLYDFTDNQWHNQLRLRRILIRGSLGEISDDTVIRLAGPRTILKSELRRSQLGYDLHLDGYDTEHISFDGEVLYQNPLIGLRLMDEEIAIATLMLATAAWASDDGPAPYSLADGSQDHLIALAIEESVRTGRPVTTAVEPWAPAS